MKKIFLYCGSGVGPGSFKQTFHRLKEELEPRYSIHPIDGQTLVNEQWEKECALVVFPGGRDLPYHQTLKGAANARLKAFVEKGGSYLGVCAGAYYGSARIEFEKGLPREIIGDRELGFFPGKAIGPAFGTFCYESEKGALHAQVRWGAERTPTSLYYNGGCYFETPQKYTNVSVLATYEENAEAAIILCKVGHGKALLSGIHPEFPSSDPSKEQKRLLIWKKMLSFLLT